MEFTTIYKNGKPQNFFIKIEKNKEFNFLQPYFIYTSIDKPRHGRILEMNCLFSGSVWYGRQSHGFGYSCSADVYGELVTIILKHYKKHLTQIAIKELQTINTHDDKLTITDATLEELRSLNIKALENKWN